MAGRPAPRVHRRHPRLDQIDRRVAAAVGDAVHRGGALQPSLGALESALRRTRAARWSPPRSVDHAIEVVLARGGQVRVETLAASAGLGVRQLERQFLEAVGLSPKRFIKTTRLQRALQLLRGGQPPADVAEACGFSDQAHLSREFRSVAGVPAREVKLEDVASYPDFSQPGINDTPAVPGGGTDPASNGAKRPKTQLWPWAAWFLP